MSPLKISAISYLNTAPLLWDFEHGQASGTFDISYTIPSGCAQALKTGEADIGIIPAAAYTSIPNLVVLGDVAIAARQAVRSILLVSKIPLDKVRTVGLDTSSMTSVALTKILFAKWLGGGRDYIAMAPNLDRMLDQCDAALLIGDPALQVDRERYVTLDLAEEWIARTGKSFVFAFWAMRRKALTTGKVATVTKTFEKSRDHGLEPENLEAIIRQWAPRLGLSTDSVRTYLTQNIHYYLDSDCLEGLRLFYQYGSELGILPAPPDLQFS